MQTSSTTYFEVMSFWDLFINLCYHYIREKFIKNVYKCTSFRYNLC